MIKYLLLLLLMMAGFASAQRSDTSHHVPADKQLPPNWKQSLYKNERKPWRGNDLYTIGMPCGGIAAGQLYVRGDGTLANWWIANNAYNTGYGVDSLTHFKTAMGPWTVCYKTFRPASYIDQGFAATVLQNGKKQTVKLNQDGFNDIAFTGEYPIAKIAYNDSRNKLPVSVTAEVYSPFIPLNEKESATPGTILQYTIKNTSSKPVQAGINGWLQNLVCLEIKDEINAFSRNRVVSKDGATSVLFDLVPGEPVKPQDAPAIYLFDDFEHGYTKWTVSGEAFGTAPASGSFGGDQAKILNIGGGHLVNSWLHGDTTTGRMISQPFTIKEDYISFKIGGGNHPGVTCFNLLIDGKVVRSSAGKNTEGLDPSNWDVKEYLGKVASFEILDASKGGWGHVNVDDIAFSNKPVTRDKYFPAMHPYNGNMALTVLDNRAWADADYADANDTVNTRESQKKTGDKICGAVGTNLILQPGESKTITFLLTWYFPNRQAYYFGSDVTDVIGNDWNTALPAEGAPILGNMYTNWYSDAMDVANHIKNNLSTLAGETHKFHNAYYNNTTLPYWLVQRSLMSLSTLATETCQWWANGKFWAWEGVGSCVGTCTHVWNYEQALAHFFPGLERNIRERTDFDVSFGNDGGIQARNGWGGILIDGHAGAILKAYREHLNSDNNLFLARNWDRIKRATQFIVNEDENEDGLIEKTQANTYDIAFYGANTYVGSLYLSALKSAAAMAGIMGDSAFKNKCERIAAAGSTNTVKRLWNGEYFVQDVNLSLHPEFQYAKGCLSDQLFGQTWSHLNRLGYLYPTDKVQKTLQSVWKYNWAPDVATQNKIHPPERTYASFGEPGLLVCTWPNSEHMGEKGVRYRDEVWTGIEYQVATNMIYENMIDEGLSMVKAVDQRYSPAKHNPWNEIECGDHYARAMASWGVMMALEDFYYNGPEQFFSFAPKIQQTNFKGFFTASKGWGNISQTQLSAQKINSIQLAYGSLRLKTLELSSLQKPSSVVITVNGKAIASSYEQKALKVLIHFDETAISAGENITATILY